MAIIFQIILVIVALVLLFATISARKPALRWIGMAVYLVPPTWAGAITMRAMAVQTGRKSVSGRCSPACSERSCSA